MQQQQQKKQQQPKSGKFLERLGQLMSDECVQQFFTDYFDTWDNGQTALMFVQAYLSIDRAYKAHSGSSEGLPNEKILLVLREMIGNSQCRRLLVDGMKEYTANSNTKFLQAWQLFAIKQKEEEEKEKEKEQRQQEEHEAKLDKVTDDPPGPVTQEFLGSCHPSASNICSVCSVGISEGSICGHCRTIAEETKHTALVFRNQSRSGQQ
jgi:hypothetical protein